MLDKIKYTNRNFKQWINQLQDKQQVVNNIFEMRILKIMRMLTRRSTRTKKEVHTFATSWMLHAA